MSHTIIKSVTFDERKKEFHLTGCASNVTPREYRRDYWVPSYLTYNEWKRFLAEQLWSGQAVFLPSCKSKAKRAYEIAEDKVRYARAAAYAKHVPWRAEDMAPVVELYMETFLHALNALIDPRFARLDRLMKPVYGDEWFMDHFVYHSSGADGHTIGNSRR